MKDETFKKMLSILEEICEISPDGITPRSHLINDLEIDSLDFLDFTYEIEHTFKVKLPIQEWTNNNEFDEEQFDHLLRLESIGNYVEFLLTPTEEPKAQK